jgi:hypothetical protein
MQVERRYCEDHEQLRHQGVQTQLSVLRVHRNLEKKEEMSGTVAHGSQPGGDRMNEAVISHFRRLASDLNKRRKTRATIILSTGSELKALYDPLFKTFTIGGMTFPAEELSIWTKIYWRALPVEVIIEEENMKTEEPINGKTTI